MEILLHQVPTKVFDSVMWSLFELRFPSQHQALKAVSEEPSTMSPLMMEATSTATGTERWQDGTQPYDLRRMMIEDFHQQLRTGELHATGIRTGGANCRRRIKPAEISRLWFDFCNNEAKGLFANYEQIEISENTERAAVSNKPISSDDILNRCVTFLNDKKAQGQNHTNLVWRHLLETYLGFPVPERPLRRALRIVFNRKRGRPRYKA